MINFSDNKKMLTVSDGGGYVATWVSVADMLKAIKAHCPREWAEATFAERKENYQAGLNYGRGEV